MTHQESPRFLEHLRSGKAISRRTAIFGGLAAGAVFVTGCGGDSSVLENVPLDTAAADTTSTSDTAGNTTTADPTVAAGTADTTSDADSTEPAADSGDSSVAASSMTVGFTYQMGSGGKNANPYIAVWVEDTSGDLIDTIAIWSRQGGRESWLQDLSDWYSAVSAAGEDYSTVSSATRTPGSYSVQWTGPDGVGIAAGDYVVHLESLREHGSLSHVSQSVLVSGPAMLAAADDGELVSVSIEVLA